MKAKYWAWLILGLVALVVLWPLIKAALVLVLLAVAALIIIVAVRVVRRRS